MKILIPVYDEHGGSIVADFLSTGLADANVHIRVLKVIPPFSCYESVAAIPDLLTNVRSTVRTNAEQLLNTVALKLKDVLQTAHVEKATVEGLPGDEVVKMANEWQAELIVLGTPGCNAVDPFSGSVSRSVIAHSPCSVVVVRPGKNDATREGLALNASGQNDKQSRDS